MIHRNCWIHVLNDPDNHNPDAAIVIKSGAGIGMGATISAIRKVMIGEHVLLAPNVYISDHGHAFEDVSVAISLQGVCKVAEVEIGDASWIGQNVCILPGVHIGKHCVIGANSVVTQDIGDYSVAVGAPARVVKRYNLSTQLWERVSKKTA